MRELDKGLEIALAGPEAEKALSMFRRQVKAWGLAMPPAEPLVLDFGLGDFQRVGLVECWIANEVEAGYCGKFLFVLDGQTCPMHHHREKHETFFVVRGRVRMTCGGAEREMAKGDVLPVDPGTAHQFTGIGPALLLEVSKPCMIDDNYFQDTAIPIGGNYPGKEPVVTLTAGAAVRDISPPRGTPLFGYPHVKRTSTGVHDPLLASALFLNDDSHSVLLVALDLLFLDRPTARSIRRAVAREASVPEACVLVSCSHTHSGPVTCRLLAWQGDPAAPDPDPAYLEFLHEQVVGAAREAVRRSRPAELAWTTADASGVGGNRLSPEGATDPETGILAVRAAGGKRPMAVALIYGMHPTVLHEDSTLVSSDFPHYTRTHLQSRFGDDLTVLYHTAPCGNQSPRYFVDGQTFEQAEQLGNKLGEAATGALETLADHDFTRHCPLAGSLCQVDLPRSKPLSVSEAEEQLADCRARYEQLRTAGTGRAEIRTAECAIFGAEGALVLARAEERGEIERALAEYRPAEVQTLRIGDAHLVGLPGEIFTEYALDIKRRSPAKTFVVSLVGGELQGYIVTPEAASQGGYEAANALFAPAAGGMMVDVALSMLPQNAQGPP